MEDKTIQTIDQILEDWSANEIKGKFDFMFRQVLEMSDGMTGPDLAEMFEMLNRISDSFFLRESERA